MSDLIDLFTTDSQNSVFDPLKVTVAEVTEYVSPRTYAEIQIAEEVHGPIPIIGGSGGLVNTPTTEPQMALVGLLASGGMVILGRIQRPPAVDFSASLTGVSLQRKLEGVIEYPAGKTLSSVVIDWGDATTTDVTSQLQKISPIETFTSTKTWAGRGTKTVTVTATYSDASTDVVSQSVKVLEPVIDVFTFTRTYVGASDVLFSATIDTRGLNLAGSYATISTDYPGFEGPFDLGTVNDDPFARGWGYFDRVAGSYTATLTVTNAYGSVTDTDPFTLT